MMIAVWMACGRTPEPPQADATAPPPFELPEPRAIPDIPWPREGFPEDDVRRVLELVRQHVPETAELTLYLPSPITFDGYGANRWPMWHVVEAGDPPSGRWRIWWRLDRDRWIGAEVELGRATVTVTYRGSTKNRPDWIRDPEELDAALLEDPALARAWLTDPEPWRRAHAVGFFSWHESPESDSILLEATRDPHAFVRAAAFDGWEPGDDNGAPSAAWRARVESALAETGRVRVAALGLLEESTDVELLRRAASLTCDRDGRTRAAAILPILRFLGEAELEPLLQDPAVAFGVARLAWEDVPSGSLAQDLADWRAHGKWRTVLLFHTDAALEDAAARIPSPALRDYLDTERRSDIEDYGSECGTPLGRAARERARETGVSLAACEHDVDLAAAVLPLPQCTAPTPTAYDIALWSPALSRHDVTFTLENEQGRSLATGTLRRSEGWIASAWIEADDVANRIRLEAGGISEVRPVPVSDHMALAAMCTIPGTLPVGATTDTWRDVAHRLFGSDRACVDTLVPHLTALPVALEGEMLGLLDETQVKGPLRDVVTRAQNDAERAAAVGGAFTSRNGAGPCRPLLSVLTDTGRLNDEWVRSQLQWCGERDPEVFEVLLRAAEAGTLDASVVLPAERASNWREHRGAALFRSQLVARVRSEDPAVAEAAFDALTSFDEVRPARGQRASFLALGDGSSAVAIQGCQGKGAGGHQIVDGVLVLERSPRSGRRVVVTDAPVHLVVCGTDRIWQQSKSRRAGR